MVPETGDQLAVVQLALRTELARVVRGRFLSLREEEFVMAAELAGGVVVLSDPSMTVISRYGMGREGASMAEMGYVVIDAAGVSASLKSALDWVRPAGQVCKVGWGPQPMNFSMDPLVRKAVTLQGSFSHNHPVWERVLSMFGSGQLDPRPYLSKVSKLEDWKDCFDGMHEGRYIKAVLTPS